MWRDLIVALVVAALLSTASLTNALARLDGLSVDLLTWFRYSLFGPLHRRDESRVAVISIDEETFRRPPFKDLPKALWTPQLAKILRATLDAGAAVIGHDLILPTSVEVLLRGYDREYLMVLRDGGRTGRLVLGQVQHLSKPISPFPGYSFAIGPGSNIRMVNLYRDPDGIIRRIPLFFERIVPQGSAQQEPSFTVELAARALKAEPRFDDQGALWLGDLRIDVQAWRGVLLNFAGGGQALPVYSLADLYACHEAGDKDYFHRAFSGKVVILGATLDVEDRKLTSARFVTDHDGAWFAPRCRLPVMDELYSDTLIRDTIPGPFIFATAINNILRNEVLSESPAAAAFAMVFFAALLASVAALKLRLAPALVIVAAVPVIWIVITVGSFARGLVVPMIDPIAGEITAFVIMLGYRFAITDSERRRIRRAFSFYLPSAVIEKLVQRGSVPQLGGETRDVTLFYSDVDGFTRVCEGLAPEDVVGIMNRYFNAVTEIIEAHGGYVDKYIGDAVLAIFGAPLTDSQHARHAVEAGLACRSRLLEIQPSLGLPEGRRLQSRIGVNSGPALIGNIGSNRRFNYTAMGDTVNLAARLESANKVYGTDILTSSATIALLGMDLAVAPLERVRVQGRDQPVELYEVLGDVAQLTQDERLRLDVLKSAWSLRESGNLAAARAALDCLSESRSVAVLIAHIDSLMAEPLVPGTLAVFDLLEK